MIGEKLIPIVIFAVLLLPVKAALLSTPAMQL